MNICVFCSGGWNEAAANYVTSVKAFGSLIGQHHHNLVWGGSPKGLMGDVADATKVSGGKIIGIGVEWLHRRHEGADEFVVEQDLVARKATMLARSDAFAILPGGIGTLDEVTEILELKKHSFHKKPIAVLNTSGFYDGLKMQLERMDNEGFLPMKLSELIFFANTPEEAMHYIESEALTQK
jgi:uncharacterized protein (TIGR00730 family)